MKKITIFILVAIVLFTIGCNRKEDSLQPQTAATGEVLVQKSNPEPVPQDAPMSKETIDKKVNEIMSERKDFRWQWTSLYMNWSAIYHAGEFAIGYKPANIEDITESIHEINIRSAEWKAVHDAIINLVLDEVNKKSDKPLTAAEIIVEDDPNLPLIVFRVTDKEVITKLFNLENTRYIEPMGYWPEITEQRSTSGCSASSQSLNSTDWTTTAPASRVPWNYHLVNIPNSWATAQGTGIKIGVIDAGISSSQTLLGSQFKDGYSNVSSRTITTGYTYGTSAYTSCTHGTSMSGLALGPRNSQNATTGVAYQSSLHFIRACQDVVLDQSSELSGVKNALVALGNQSTVRIISMSIGTPFYSSVLYDGVTYAYGKGKMLFAAAGTSYGWTSWYGVIYPAKFSQCIAVTGVKENGSRCSSCHDGSEVEFTIPMERDANSNRNSLSLATSGYTPTYIGGSSCATAMSAGIAAVVWSANPSLTRSQVYTCLRNTSQFYPGISSSKGYGNLNAAAAVTMALGM